MTSTVLNFGPALAVACVLLVLVGTLVAWVGHTGLEREIPWAAVRATIQLVLLALVLGAVVHRLPLALVFLLVMVGAACVTAARRAATRTGPGAPTPPHWWRSDFRRVAWCVLPVAVGPLVLTAVLLAVGVVPVSGLAIIPVAGILLGNAMAIVGLAGRRAGDELAGRRGEVEAGLALGLSSFSARLMICRDTASSALVPALDQTKTIGLVTIPGSFVGMILGGATPWEAGIMQLLVSIGILATGSVALVLTVLLVAGERI